MTGEALKTPITQELITAIVAQNISHPDFCLPQDTTIDEIGAKIYLSLSQALKNSDRPEHLNAAISATKRRLQQMLPAACLTQKEISAHPIFLIDNPGATADEKAILAVLSPKKASARRLASQARKPFWTSQPTTTQSQEQETIA